MSDTTRSRAPIVFAGPSVRELPPQLRQRLDLRPPAQRGSLESLRGNCAPGIAVLIDGVFGASMAVTPTECRHLLEDGWILLGASSMGALRAAELWSLGMLGIGDIYLHFRIDPIPSDADVAVAYNPDTFEELTISVVQLRAMARALRHAGWSQSFVDDSFASAADIYWCERTWPRVRERWSRLTDGDRAFSAASAWAARPGTHPKVRDANLAIEGLLTSLDDVGSAPYGIDEALSRLENRSQQKGETSWPANPSS